MPFLRHVAGACALILAPLSAQQLTPLESPILDFGQDLGTGPVAAGDLNGDGLDDIVAGGWLFPNPGDGRFTAPSSELEGLIVVADLDGDGRNEAIANGRGTQIWAQLFGRLRDVTSGLVDPQLAVGHISWPADFDNDGDIDIFQGIRTLIRTSRGYHSAIATPLASPFPSDVHAADFDGDGLLDAVVTAGGATVLRNLGGASFRDVTVASLPSGGIPLAVRVEGADFDGDGDEDLAFVRQAFPLPSRLVLLENDGTGTFRDATNAWFSNAPAPTEILTGDFDGDGDVDLVLGSEGATVDLARNDGSGRFTTAHREPTSSSPGTVMQLRSLDADGDGQRDVIATTFGSRSTARTYDLFRNSAGTRLVRQTRHRIPNTRLHPAVALVDIDGDGLRDMLLGAEGLFASVNDGTGRFRDETASRVPSLPRVYSIVTGDFDHDGDLDAIVHLGVGERDVLRNDGTGVFTRRQLSPPVPGNGSPEMELGDVDGDGDLDLYCPNLRQDQLFLGDGAGGFADVTATHLPVHLLPASTATLADFDGDGDLDVFTTAGFGVDIRGDDRLLRNDGTGRFTDVSATALPRTNQVATDAEPIDIDGDGDVDLVIGEARGVLVYGNDGSGSFRDVTTQWVPHVLGAAVALADLTGDGATEIALTRATLGTGPVLQLLRRTAPGGRFVIDPGLAPFVAGPVAQQPVFGDLDGDDDVDAFVGLPDGFGARRDQLLLNRLRQLDAPFVPTLGGSDYELVVHQRDGGGANGAIAWVCVGTARLANPIVFPGLGTLRLDLQTAVCTPPVFVGSGSGVGTLRVPIPLDAALDGLVIHSQALVAPQGDLSRAHLTGVVTDTLRQ